MPYIITYDLHAPGQDYEKLEKAIKELGQATRIASSTWILIHPGPVKAIRDYLLNYIDENDKLIVIECLGNIAWYGIKPALEIWLRTHL